MTYLLDFSLPLEIDVSAMTVLTGGHLERGLENLATPNQRERVWTCQKGHTVLQLQLRMIAIPIWATGDDDVSGSSIP